ncbi:hypothetical protein ACN47E_001680 [Coniothyrium glycines]
MRLLQRLAGGHYQLVSFHDDDLTPPYAILSHTWSEGQEVTYRDLIDGTGHNKTGFAKIHFCNEQAVVDGLHYFWVDTCCIDKSSSNELSTAINSMFKYYQRATKCYVYLADVSVPEQVSNVAAIQTTWADAFQRSRWFTRGWTLQELLAPPSVEFFSAEGKRLGDRISLEQEIHKITKIPVSVLRGHDISVVSFDDRMSWAAPRVTTIKEDRVYCLLGIFGVFLPLIYGEGEAHARGRLDEEIRKRKVLQLGQSRNSNAVKPESMHATCVIPFRQDPDFIDRGTLLDEMQKKSLAPASRIALVGLGGVGKSQLAIEYCYRTADRFPGTWVFWVHAGSATRLEQSYRDIADQVELPGRSEPQANIFELVRNWLRDEKNGQWLLVLDNADDAAVLATLPGQVQGHLSGYLPPSKHGSVVVTSRVESVASHLVEEQDIIHINPMHVTDAQNLLQKKLSGAVAADEISELAAAVEYIPLALVQAAAYISKRGIHYSIQQYLEEFRKNDKRKVSLLNQEAGHLRRNEEAKNSIIITWQISFELIWRTRRSAADLLSLMSFFDRQGIPKALLLGSNVTKPASRDVRADNDEESDSAEDDDGASGCSTDDRFVDDILTLRDYSFVAETTDPETLEMHSLVQLATQKWLEGRGEAERWRQQFISALCLAFPTGNYENWDTCRSLYPHVILASLKRTRDEWSRKEWAELMCNAAWYAHERADIHEAERLAIASMKTRTKLLGAENEDTLRSMAMVGLVYKLAGRWAAAEELEVKVMNMRRIKLGVDHPDTLTSMNNLASTYWNQDRWEAAEELEVQVMDIRKLNLGVDHPKTLVSMHNLATTYRSQGRWEAAEDLEVQVVEICKTKLGEDHPNTLGCITNLALIYGSQGRWEAAEELETKVFEIRKTKLGIDHPDTLVSMNNLAITLKAQSRDAEAIALMQQCVQLWVSKLGATHPHTISSATWLASWESQQAA